MRIRFVALFCASAQGVRSYVACPVDHPAQRCWRSDVVVHAVARGTRSRLRVWGIGHRSFDCAPSAGSGRRSDSCLGVRRGAIAASEQEGICVCARRWRVCDMCAAWCGENGRMHITDWVRAMSGCSLRASPPYSCRTCIRCPGRNSTPSHASSSGSNCAGVRVTMVAACMLAISSPSASYTIWCCASIRFPVNLSDTTVILYEGCGLQPPVVSTAFTNVASSALRICRQGAPTSEHLHLGCRTRPHCRHERTLSSTDASRAACVCSALMHSARTAGGTRVAAAHRSAVGLPPASAARLWTLDRRYTHATIPRDAATRRMTPAHRIVAAEPNAQGSHRAAGVGAFVLLCAARATAHALRALRSRDSPGPPRSAPRSVLLVFAAVSPTVVAGTLQLSVAQQPCGRCHERAQRIPRRCQCTSTRTGQEHRPDTRSATPPWAAAVRRKRLTHKPHRPQVTLHGRGTLYQRRTTPRT